MVKLMTLIFERPQPHFGKYVKDFRHEHQEKNAFISYKTMWVYDVDFVDVDVKKQCILISNTDQTKINTVSFYMFDNLCVE